MTPHDLGYSTVLIRLASVDPSALREVLEQAWRRRASKKALAAYDRREGAQGWSPGRRG